MKSARKRLLGQVFSTGLLGCLCKLKQVTLNFWHPHTKKWRFHLSRFATRIGHLIGKDRESPKGLFKIISVFMCFLSKHLGKYSSHLFAEKLSPCLLCWHVCFDSATHMRMTVHIDIIVAPWELYLFREYIYCFSRSIAHKSKDNIIQKSTNKLQQKPEWKIVNNNKSNKSG